MHPVRSGVPEVEGREGTLALPLSKIPASLDSWPELYTGMRWTPTDMQLLLPSPGSGKLLYLIGPVWSLHIPDSPTSKPEQDQKELISPVPRS